MGRQIGRVIGGRNLNFVDFSQQHAIGFEADLWGVSVSRAVLVFVRGEAQSAIERAIDIDQRACHRQGLAIGRGRHLQLAKACQFEVAAL